MSAFQNFVANNVLLSNALKVVTDYIIQKHTSEYTYHDLHHTLRVTQNAYNLGFQQPLAQSEMEDLVIAALFHDTGYYESTNDHEAIGAQIARDFLVHQSIPTDRIQRIEALILSTKVTTQPTTKLQEILCDADLNYLGATDFFSLVERLRLEWQLTGRKNFSEAAWIQQNIDFFEQHTFYTSTAQNQFGHVKASHLEQMRSDLRALSDPS